MMRDKNVVGLAVTGGKVYKFVFHSEDVAEEALGLVQSHWKKGERSALAKEQVLSRAVAIASYTATSPTELSLKPDDVVLVTSKPADSSMWEGRLEYTYDRGLFPSSCVVETTADLTVSDELRESGYSKLEHVPTNEEWERIIMGGREVTYRKVGCEQTPCP